MPIGARIKAVIAKVLPRRAAERESRVEQTVKRQAAKAHRAELKRRGGGAGPDDGGFSGGF